MEETELTTGRRSEAHRTHRKAVWKKTRKGELEDVDASSSRARYRAFRQAHAHTHTNTYTRTHARSKSTAEFAPHETAGSPFVLLAVLFRNCPFCPSVMVRDQHAAQQTPTSGESLLRPWRGEEAEPLSLSFSPAVCFSHLVGPRRVRR